MTLTLPQAFAETVARHGGRDALRTKENGAWRAISYAEYGKRVRSLACALVELGAAAGDRIGLLSENRPEWVITDQAIMRAGGVTVPVYPTLTAAQVAYILNDCGAKIVLVSSEAQLKKLLEQHASLNALEHVVVMGEFQQPAQFTRVYRFGDLIELGAQCEAKHGAEVEARLAALTGDSLASIVYTSGTTGEPKGAMLTQGNMSANVESVLPIIGITHEDSALSFLPLSHVLERCANFALVRAGGLVNFAESVEAVPQNLMEVKPTVLASVPRLFEKVKGRVFDKVAQDPPVRQKLFHWALGVGDELRRAREAGKGVSFALALQHTLADRLVFTKIRARVGGNLKFCLSGGAPLPADVGQFFETIGIRIIEGYGLTETSPIISINRPDDVRYGTVGKPLPGVEVKLAADGELLCRGHNVMKGYYNKPDATAEAIDADGWFHTGDVAVFDEAGRIRIVDRKKEILVMSNGKNVAPQPIENALKASRFIEQAMLIGDQRNFITALLVPNFEALEAYAAEHRIDASKKEALVAHPQVQALFRAEVEAAGADFAQFEKVKKFTVLPRAFEQERDELTPTLKVKRRVISKSFAAEIEAMYGAEAVSA